MSQSSAYVKSLIRRRYADLAAAPGAVADGCARAINAGYSAASIARAPDALVRRWSGCGGLADLVDLRGMRTVVDLGCGGGLDTWLIATGPSPPESTIAVDLTPEMLAALPRHGRANSGGHIWPVAGDMEQLPLAEATCDLAIANASLNLATNKPAVMAEAFRILRPGGRLFACELVREGGLPAELLADPMGHATSLGGVAGEAELIDLVTRAGFDEVEARDHRPFPPVSAVNLSARKPVLSIR